MSDWLLQGVDPKNPDGREFYLHTADEWFDIVAIVDHALRQLLRGWAKSSVLYAFCPRVF